MCATTTAGLAEIARAAGAVLVTPPPGSAAVCTALQLQPFAGSEYTEAFVLLAPPHAAIHLSEKGTPGGDALDRVEGLWRAIGAPPPADADHLGVLLMAWAQLVEDGSPSALRVANVLVQEHIWSWAPGYLSAVAALGIPSVTAWSDLTLQVLRAATHPWSGPPQALPAALRDAPAALPRDVGREDLLDAMVAPVRCGFILTQRDVAMGAAQIGVGYRRGERRFALTAMLDQDPTLTLQWLADHSAAWAKRHTELDGVSASGQWWSARARATSDILAALVRGAP